MNEQTIVEQKKPVTGPKKAVGFFNRARDGQQIWIYPRKRESRDAAIARVTKRHGAQESEVTPCK